MLWRLLTVEYDPAVLRLYRSLDSLILSGTAARKYLVRQQEEDFSLDTQHANTRVSVYTPTTSGGGQLSFVGGIPVLCVGGSPEAIGNQVAELALRPAARLMNYPTDYLRSQIPVPLLPRLIWSLVSRPCRKLYRNFPERYRAELEAMANCGFDLQRLIAANTLFDMAQMGFRPMFGCSSWVARPEQTGTGGLLFGRNLDFFPLGYLHDFSLITVYAPSAEAHGFASIGFPGTVGCFSGMNQFGLCLARHEVFTPLVKTTYNPKGVPFAVCFRDILETCRTVDEAIRLVERTPHVTVSNLVVCDPDGGALVELAPEGVKSRPISAEMHSCTNHFSHPDWQNPRQANAYHTQERLTRLEAAPVVGVGVEDVQRVLDDVNQGDLTIQTMVFDPSAVAVHVAFGSGPTTQRPLTRIDLAPYWAT